MKSLLSVLDVKTDRIYHPVSAGKCIGDWPLVVNVGFDRLKLRIIKTKQPVPSIGMPWCYPDGKPVFTEMPNDAAAEEPGSAENGDDAIVHGRRASNSSTDAGAVSTVRFVGQGKPTQLYCRMLTTTARVCDEAANWGGLILMPLKVAQELVETGDQRLWSRDRFLAQPDLLGQRVPLPAYRFDLLVRWSQKLLVGRSVGHAES
jgi:hypothetical protein